MLLPGRGASMGICSACVCVCWWKSQWDAVYSPCTARTRKKNKHLTVWKINDMPPPPLSLSTARRGAPMGGCTSLHMGALGLNFTPPPLSSSVKLAPVSHLISPPPPPVPALPPLSPPHPNPRHHCLSCPLVRLSDFPPSC